MLSTFEFWLNWTQGVRAKHCRWLSRNFLFSYQYKADTKQNMVFSVALLNGTKIQISLHYWILTRFHQGLLKSILWTLPKIKLISKAIVAKWNHSALISQFWAAHNNYFTEPDFGVPGFVLLNFLPVNWIIELFFTAGRWKYLRKKCILQHSKVRSF